MPPALIAAGVAAAGSVAGGLISSSAAKKAANSQQRAADQSTALQRYIFDTIRGDQAFTRAGGNAALGQILSGLGIDPGTLQAAGGGPVGGEGGAQAYLDAYPDVAAEAARYPGVYGDQDGDGDADRFDFALGHHQRYGQSEGRTSPAALRPTTQTSAPAGTGGPAPTPPGYQAPTRPDAPARPEVQRFTPTTGQGYTAPAFRQGEALSPAQAYQPNALAQFAGYQGPQLTANPLDSMRRPEVEQFARRDRSADPTLDLSVERFRADPGYEFRQAEAARAIEGGAASRGGLLSGATLKALQQRSGDLADQAYYQWADRERGQYNTDRGVLDARYAFDTGTDQQAQQFAQQLRQAGYTADQANQLAAWQFGNSFNQRNSEFGASLGENARQTDNALLTQQGQFGATLGEQQRQFGANFGEQQRQYDNNLLNNSSQFGATFNEGQRQSDNALNVGLSQYYTSLGQQNFNTDRARSDDLFNIDRSFSYGQSRDRQNDLFNIANLGQGAAAQIGQAGQNYATQAGNAMFSAANAQGNAALSSASNWMNGINNGVNALAYYLGNRNGGGNSNPLGMYNI